MPKINRQAATNAKIKISRFVSPQQLGALGGLAVQTASAIKS